MNKLQFHNKKVLKLTNVLKYKILIDEEMIEGESRMRVKHKKRMKRVLAMILTAAITLQTGFSPVASAATGSETAKAGSSTVEMDVILQKEAVWKIQL